MKIVKTVLNKKFRIIEVGGRFYVQFRMFFIWFMERDVNTEECIIFGSLKSAEKYILESLPRFDDIPYQ